MNSGRLENISSKSFSVAILFGCLGFNWRSTSAIVASGSCVTADDDWVTAAAVVGRVVAAAGSCAAAVGWVVAARG